MEIRVFSAKEIPGVKPGNEVQAPAVLASVKYASGCPLPPLHSQGLQPCNQQSRASADSCDIICPHDHEAITIPGMVAFSESVSFSPSWIPPKPHSSRSLCCWLGLRVLIAPGFCHPLGLCSHNQPAAPPEPFSKASPTMLCLQGVVKPAHPPH